MRRDVRGIQWMRFRPLTCRPCVIRDIQIWFDDTVSHICANNSNEFQYGVKLFLLAEISPIPQDVGLGYNSVCLPRLVRPWPAAEILWPDDNFCGWSLCKFLGAVTCTTPQPPVSTGPNDRTEATKNVGTDRKLIESSCDGWGANTRIGPEDDPRPIVGVCSCPQWIQ